MLSSAGPSKINYELALAANPLSNRPIFQSNDIGEAEQLVAQTADPHRLQVLNSHHNLAGRFDDVFLKDIALLHVYYGPDLQVEPIQQKNFFFTKTALRGHTEVKLGGRAIAYIEEHANKPLTVTDIASTVGVTARALQKGFQRTMDQTPAEYIRNLRLGHVHQALQKADGSQNVTEILLHHGVRSFGHFGRSYKQNYDVTPCETLRRAGATQLVSTCHSA